MSSPVERGEACRQPGHRPSLGGTPTSGCPCGSLAEEAPPAPLSQPNLESLVRARTVQSWFDNHMSRWDALDAEMTELMQPFQLEGPGLEPAFRSYTTPGLEFAPPAVRFLCPSGHLVDDVVVQRAWDGESDRERWTFRVRRTRRFREPEDLERGLHVQAPGLDQPRMPSEEVGLRNRARCRNNKCRYDGRVKLEDLLKLYALAVKTGTRDVRLPD